MKKIIIFLGLIFSISISAQTYNMQTENGNVVTTCTGTFVDSGGVNGGYASGENYQVTFCPSDADSYIQLDFTAFDIEGEPWDFMTIYDGIGTGGNVIANYGDITPPMDSTCGTLLGSNDTSGCITIVFESDSSFQYSGWEATISCTTTAGGDSLGGGGDGTGTSDLGCPSVITGGLGLGDVDPSVICPTDPENDCTDLEATYLQLGDTSDYTVTSIPYAPPYQFECLANNINTGNDDEWSSAINLPFDFCFYGNTYNSCVAGSNGIISFDASLAGSSAGYQIENDLPSTVDDLFENSIYGVYHDINPAAGGEIGWELITLNSGCRALVAAWHDVPMFSENSLLYTGMMVLYENTNIIEVYIEEKNIDGTWNDGNAIVGIQNEDATNAVVAPGRNALDPKWSATNEAWRFTPSGTSITSLTWYEGVDNTGTVVGTSDVITVCPVVTTTYTAEIVYTLCDGSQISETESTIVTIDSACTACDLILDTDNNNQNVCENAPIDDIVYTVGENVTEVEATLPSGLTGYYNETAGTYTISGKPTTPIGTSVNYSISTVGCVANLTETGTIDNSYCTVSKGLSPNGDGVNDTWDLSNFDVRELKIYNRYGSEIYSKSPYFDEWDGTSNGNELPDGSYYYVIVLNNNTTKTGWVYINK
jgi:gliding motility-associated-like protein